MTVSEKLRSDIIAKAKLAAGKKLKADDRKKFDLFFAPFTRHTPLDDILEVGADHLGAAALAGWRFIQAHQLNDIAVDIYNPTPQSGLSSRFTVIEILNDDRPFLVDSVGIEINRLGYNIHALIHPTYRAMRQTNGKLKDIIPMMEEREGYKPESYIQVYIEPITGQQQVELKKQLVSVLSDVRAAVLDWPAMRNRAQSIMEDLDKCPKTIPQEQIEQAKEFLAWMIDNKFTFLGYNEYRYVTSKEGVRAYPVPESNLGVATQGKGHIFSKALDAKNLPTHVRDFILQPQLLTITKTNANATVHRAVQMDSVGIKKYNTKGHIVGEYRMIGLFTSVAYRKSASEIPILRQKIKRVWDRSGFTKASHNGKALIHILETLPRDELFQISEDDLYRISLGVLHLRERQRVAFFAREDAYNRFISCFIYIPRDRYNTDLRTRIQDYLIQSFQAESFNSSVDIGESPQVRIHIMLNLNNGIPDYNIEKIEHYISELSRRWDDDLVATLKQVYGLHSSEKLINNYRFAFPPSYQEFHSPAIAIKDIERMEECLATQSVALRLYQAKGSENRPDFNIKIYSHLALFHLSTILPTLENMGLKGLTEIPYEISLGDGRTVWVQDFHMRPRFTTQIHLEKIRAFFKKLLRDILADDLEDDLLNALVLTGEMTGRQISVLRAYGQYLKQIGSISNSEGFRSALIENSTIALDLVHLFEARFDPSVKNREALETKYTSKIEQALDVVSNVDYDRVIRRILNAIQSTLRTNYYQPDAHGRPKPYIAFKVNSKKLIDMPKPVPYAEIFVYSPRVEAIHLRSGRVARGGLRWSDRPDDFRTEVLGLMKAQIVKNSVIVPVGSKGGFFVKRLPKIKDPAHQKAEVIECYKIFIRGLLDITDNLKGKTVMPPSSVIRHDKDDPYLVVAADKGTASFSDIANGVAAEYGFWLGDAFASGGSKGYSHKDLAITARGGWESVKRHFREIGIDCQSQDFTAIGVGDMAGDVFGNGMLLSKHLKLIAAFNHAHIFIDPTPDAAKSFAERQRLFNKPGSSWNDYDRKLISKGGGVFDRKEKKITLSAEMKQVFGSDAGTLTPTELIRVILKSPVDLLWLGGIGTFVKGADENNAEVGDKANDALRINGSELKARIVGEGANLGFTQQGRIEYALKNGRLNTDFIDNSAGVDCSDHEVNIKILLDAAVVDRKLSVPARNKLLQSMQDDVCQLVLRDNYLQTQIISLEERARTKSIDVYGRLITSLARKGILDPQFEHLPDAEELTIRQSKGLGFTRPEIALLLSYTKNDLYDQVLASSLPDDPLMVRDLMNYFPEKLQKSYLTYIKDHKLRREIISTYVTNSIVNRVSIAFVNEMREKTGRSVVDVARCYAVVRDAFDLRSLWRQLEALDLIIPTETQYALMESLVKFTERSVHWLLQNMGEAIDTQTSVLRLAPLAQNVSANLRSVLTPQESSALMARVEELAKKSVPSTLAKRLATLPYMESVLDLSTLTSDKDKNLKETTKLFFRVGRRLHIQHLKQFVRTLVAKGDWHQQAIDISVEELMHLQARLTQLVLATPAGPEKDKLDAWIKKHPAAIERLDNLVRHLNSTPGAGVSAITVINQYLHAIVSGGLHFAT